MVVVEPDAMNDDLKSHIEVSKKSVKFADVVDEVP